MNDHIIEYLDYYIEIDNPQYAILLIGNWGCGKTYFIKDLIKKWEEPESAEDKITLKPIYVSLNGITDTNTINEKIRAVISPFLYSKGMKVAKNIFKGLLKTTAKIDLNFDESDDADGNISFDIDSLGIFDSANKDIKGRRVLIFDDIERCMMKTDEIFGYINNFVEHSGCKVILLTDEKKIKAKYEKNKSDIDIDYKDFKEKLIGQTFEVKSNIDVAVNYFIEESKIINPNLNLAIHESLIKELFISSELENLRVLKQSILDFYRLTTFIDNEFIEHGDYDEFIKNILAYFIIVYAEKRTGNDKIQEYQEFNYFNKDEDSPCKIAEAKYDSLLDKYNCHHSTSIFPINKIVAYIEKGFIPKEELNNGIKSNVFFRKDEEQDWEKLWNWRNLDDKLFMQVRDNVWKQFSKGEINNIYIVLHIVGIFISLINESLLNKNKKYVLSKSKQIIKRLYQNIKAELDQNLVFGYFDNHSWGKEYQAKETLEFIELKEYLNNQVEDYKIQINCNYTKNIFNNLKENSVNEIYSQLDEVLPDRHGTYERTAVFKYVDGKKLGRRIKSFNANAIIAFKWFIHRRYYPEEKYSNVTLEAYHKEDFECLLALSEELGRNMKSRELIKNRSLNELIVELEKVIDKINNI